MKDSQRLRNANANALEARNRMLLSLHSVKDRLRPSSLANRAAGTVREKAEDIALTGAQAMTRRPVLAIGAAAVAGALLVRRLFRRKGRKRS